MQLGSRISLLSPEQVDFLRDKVFRLLERNGVRIEHPEALEILDRAGARPDPDSGVVRFPEGALRELLAQAPRRLTIYGRNGAGEVEIPRPDGTFHLRSCTGAYNIIDPETGAHRKVTLADVAAWAKLVSGLDEVSFCGFPFAGDAPVQTADVHALKTMLANTDKHVWVQPYSAGSVEYLIKLAAAAGGGQPLRCRPPVSIFSTALTPLTLKPMDAEIIVQAARRGMPLHVCSLPSAGGTAPLTMPGLVVLAAAETLAMLATAQAAAPGAPVVILVNVFALDMRTGASLQSSIEAMQGAALFAQFVKQAFGVPTHTYGLGSDSPDVDGQSMIERSLLGLLVGLSGADILGGAGQIEVVKTISPIQLVIDNELAGMIRGMISVPAIDDETVAWDDLLAASPGSHFLTTDHTLRHCRDAFAPRAFARLSRTAWEKEGKRDLVARAGDVHRAIMDGEGPGAPPADVVEELESIVAAADRKLLG